MPNPPDPASTLPYEEYPRDLGHYQLLKQLGRGGMGVVHLAQDRKLGRQVAIKALPATTSEDPSVLKRFRQEAQMLAKLNHPNVATLYALEEIDGGCYLAMEYVEGSSLSALIRSQSLSRPDILRICRGIAAALEYAHREGVIHRDLKPGNVIVATDGEARVLDFGLARAIDDSSVHQLPEAISILTERGLVLGTPGYISPEQIRGTTVDHRTDIWAFGCVLFECLTGQLAFPAHTFTQSLAMILEHDPDFSRLPADVPPQLGAVVARCLQKDPDARESSMGTIRQELEDVAAGAGQPSVVVRAEPARPPAESKEPKRSMRWVAALMILGVLCVGGFFLFEEWKQYRQEQAALGELLLIREQYEPESNRAFPVAQWTRGFERIDHEDSAQVESAARATVDSMGQHYGRLLRAQLPDWSSGQRLLDRKESEVAVHVIELSLGGTTGDCESLDRLLTADRAVGERVTSYRAALERFTAVASRHNALPNSWLGFTVDELRDLVECVTTAPLAAIVDQEWSPKAPEPLQSLLQYGAFSRIENGVFAAELRQADPAMFSRIPEEPPLELWQQLQAELTSRAERLRAVARDGGIISTALGSYEALRVRVGELCKEADRWRSSSDRDPWYELLEDNEGRELFYGQSMFTRGLAYPKWQQSALLRDLVAEMATEAMHSNVAPQVVRRLKQNDEKFRWHLAELAQLATVAPVDEVTGVVAFLRDPIAEFVKGVRTRFAEDPDIEALKVLDWREAIDVAPMPLRALLEEYTAHSLLVPKGRDVLEELQVTGAFEAETVSGTTKKVTADQLPAALRANWPLRVFWKRRAEAAAPLLWKQGMFFDEGSVSKFLHKLKELAGLNPDLEKAEKELANWRDTLRRERLDIRMEIFSLDCSQLAIRFGSKRHTLYSGRGRVFQVALQDVAEPNSIVIGETRFKTIWDLFYDEDGIPGRPAVSVKAGTLSVLCRVEPDFKPISMGHVSALWSRGFRDLAKLGEE